jgi:DNA-binding GntR family transcriptional regulator
LKRLSWEEPVHGCDHEGVQRGPERPGERVEADLRRRIGAREWKAGQMLPTVAQLAEHYAVSPGVIQRVERRLEAAGLVRIVARWGVFRS